MYWRLKDLAPPKPDAPTVFSCFHCGGGSTMGYKLAGFKVFGGVEIDPKMMEIYRENHHPEHSYLMGVQEFKNIPDWQLPKELFNLDVLDGSPPCSSFSTAGSREKDWGKNKKFREGQAEQVLDELFFDFIDIAKKLNPKVVVAENVSGLIKGNAKFYVKRIVEAFDAAGYECQLFLLNAAFMGVPQRRERTFFIARRRGLFDKIKLDFNEELIPFSKIDDGKIFIEDKFKLTPRAKKYWDVCKPGDSFLTVHEKKHLFNSIKIHKDRPLNTLVSGAAETTYHHSQERKLTVQEWRRGQTFPEDFNFLNNNPKYVIGMSVPPKMMEKVALELRKQWLSQYKIIKKPSSGA